MYERNTGITAMPFAMPAHQIQHSSSTTKPTLRKRDEILGKMDLRAINPVAADGQTAAVLSGQLQQELIQCVVQASRYWCHGHTVAKPAFPGQTRGQAKYGSYNRGFSPLYGTTIPRVNGGNWGQRFVEAR
jgi:hypothetical protein